VFSADGLWLLVFKEIFFAPRPEETQEEFHFWILNSPVSIQKISGRHGNKDLLLRLRERKIVSKARMKKVNSKPS